MTVTLLDFLMILSLGILAGTGSGLLIGFVAGKQTRDWAAMQKKDKITTILLVLTCSAVISAVLAWYIFRYAGT
jgi:ABC-type antimicrobial peptide transport system permease subunit